MLGNNNLCHATEVVAILILIDVIVFRTMYKQHHISILLDSSRLTEV